jgi:hypothetical protein
MFKPGTRITGTGLLAACLVLGSFSASSAVADESIADNSAAAPTGSAFIDLYALGIGEHDTDEFTTVTGWRFNDSWSFGYQDGEDSGLSLVWQKSQDQMSISNNGIRFTRRF